MRIINYSFNDTYEKMLKDHLDFIEKQSYKIVKKHFADNSKTGDSAELEIENRSLELSNYVLDILKRDDFKVLRNFNGRSKITTYLTTIIARQFVDIIRKKMGRSREKERAKEFGELGLSIHKSIFIEKNSIEEFFKLNQENNKITIEKIEEIVDSIKGKNYDKNDIDNFPGSPVKKGIHGDDEILIPDKNKTPEQQIIFEEKKQIQSKNLDLVLSNLTREEKFILKLRFYNEKDDKKHIIENIANLLKINRRAVYKRIDRILKKCKKILAKNGIKANELF